jgi:hypothetical protein
MSQQISGPHEGQSENSSTLRANGGIPRKRLVQATVVAVTIGTLMIDSRFVDRHITKRHTR